MYTKACWRCTHIYDSLNIAQLIYLSVIISGTVTGWVQAWRMVYSYTFWWNRISCSENCSVFFSQKFLFFIFVDLTTVLILTSYCTNGVASRDCNFRRRRQHTVTVCWEHALLELHLLLFVTISCGTKEDTLAISFMLNYWYDRLTSAIRCL